MAEKGPGSRVPTSASLFGCAGQDGASWGGGYRVVGWAFANRFQRMESLRPGPNVGADMTSPVSKAYSGDLSARARRADTPPAGWSGGSRIVFVDGAIAGAEALATGACADVVAVILDPGRDGVRQIADYLRRHDVHGAAAIAIVAHGASGLMRIAGTTLSAATIARHRPLLSRIGAALRPGGDILLYGCDVAQDAAGAAFLQLLSRFTGGANIAASSHPVGAAAAGGDWNLDVRIGTIDAARPFTPQALAGFAGVLAIVGVNQLFASFYRSLSSSDTRVEQLGVSGSALNGTPIDVRDGSQTTTFSQLYGVAVDAPLGKYFLVNSDTTTVSQIVVGNVAGGAPTVLYDAGVSASFQLSGLTIDQPNHTLYFAKAGPTGQGGIYKIDESGGTPTAVVTGLTVPLNLSLDTNDGLVFFVENNGIGRGINKLEVGNLSTGAS